MQSQAGATGVLAGAVLADSTERPIADAEVALPALRLRTRSDSMGVFTLRGVTAGRHVVVVRAIGYGDLSMPVLFRRGETLTIDVLLTAPAQRLSPVDVVAPKASGNNPRIAEFDERRKIGFGEFLTQEDFAKAEGRNMLNVLTSRIPGVRIVGTGRRTLVSSRGVISFSRSQCPIRVIFDGIPDAAPLDLDSIEPSTIAAAEYYTPATLPAQFNFGGNSPCGTLLLWSRW
ncbi:carboxypeptidase regulatory-like domain-containing protein [Gemmatimonas groenlandica]|uniref:carboxypeptidase regulatory-like domain-containing protein n=1 Tax=Gemmatimonas groenlandica TaxID=2732249 RepID=UPI00197E3B64|nr:carboxypeptidase regulatory-like domain-containing protein [Gemmatimonas groenlandica]